MAADQPGMARQRRLRDSTEPEHLGGEHEIADIGTAIDRAVDPERLIGMDDGDMRRTEEVVVLQRLFCVSRLVAARDAERVVKLKPALAAALEIDSAIFPRWREIMVVPGAGSGLRIDQFA